MRIEYTLVSAYKRYRYYSEWLSVIGRPKVIACFVMRSSLYEAELRRVCLSVRLSIYTVLVHNSRTKKFRKPQIDMKAAHITCIGNGPDLN